MKVIHPTAIVSSGAELADDVYIGPYCLIGPNVIIGNNTRLLSHVVIDGYVTIGENCRIFPFASIGTETQDLKYKGAKTFVEIGDNTTLREYVTVNSATEDGQVTHVGSRCLLMACSHVAHACHVGDEVIMANSAALAGHVVVENQCVIGGITGVHQFVKIGRLCMIGGCSKVTQDCPPFMLIDGNPARAVGLNIIGLKRRNIPEKNIQILKEAYRILYRQQLSRPHAIEKINQELEKCAELEHLLDFISSTKRGLIKGGKE